MQYKDYYKTLGVDKKADQDTIKKSYRKLAKKYHPDKHPNDSKGADQFKEINEAYEVLGNIDKRKKYDQLSSQAARGNGADFDPSAFGYQYSGQGGNRQYQSSGDFSDFFEAFFGDQSNFNFEDLFGGGSSKTYTSSRGQFDAANQANSNAQYRMGNNRNDYTAADVEAELSLTPDEAYRGVVKKFKIQIGQQDKTLSVKIPGGVLSGEKIKLKGQGQPIDSSGVSGDLYLHINIVDAPGIKLDGLDLITVVSITPWEAALGSDIRINALSGTVKLKIPPGTDSGKRFRLNKKGYKNRKGETGNLYIEVKIVVPPAMNEEEMELLKKWKDVSTFEPKR